MVEFFDFEDDLTIADSEPEDEVTPSTRNKRFEHVLFNKHQKSLVIEENGEKIFTSYQAPTKRIRVIQNGKFYVTNNTGDWSGMHVNWKRLWHHMNRRILNSEVEKEVDEL